MSEAPSSSSTTTAASASPPAPKPPAKKSFSVSKPAPLSTASPATQSRSNTGSSSSSTPQQQQSNPPSPQQQSTIGKKPQFKMSLPPRKLENLHAVSLTPVTTPGAQFSANPNNVFQHASSNSNFYSVGSGSFNPAPLQPSASAPTANALMLNGNDFAAISNPNSEQTFLGQINTNSTTSGTFSDAPSPGGVGNANGSTSNNNNNNNNPNGMSTFTSSSTTDTTTGSSSVSNNNNNKRDSSLMSNHFTPSNSSGPGQQQQNQQQNQQQQNQQQQWFPNVHTTSSKASPLLDAYANTNSSAFANANSSSSVISQSSFSSTNAATTTNNFHAHEVYPNVYLGSVVDAENANLLRSLGITHILNVALECDFSESVQAAKQFITTKKVPLRDNADEDITRVFAETFEFIEAGVQQGGKVLVHCFVGSSRSPTVVIAYIMKKLWQQSASSGGAIAGSRKYSLPNMMMNENNSTTMYYTNNSSVVSSSGGPPMLHQGTATFQNQSTHNFGDCGGDNSNHHQNLLQQEKTANSSAVFGTGLSTSSTNAQQPTAIFTQSDENATRKAEFGGDLNDNEESSQSVIASLSSTLPNIEESPTKSTTSNKNNNEQQQQHLPKEKDSFYNQALAIVQSKRVECYPNIGFAQALMEYEKALKSLTPPVLTPRMSPQRTQSPRKMSSSNNMNLNNNDNSNNNNNNNHNNSSTEVTTSSWGSPDDSTSSASNLHRHVSSSNNSIMTRANTSAPSIVPQS